VISSAASFFCFEFVVVSNIPPSAGLDVRPPRRLRYIFFPSLGIMARVLTAFHFPVAHIDDITRLIAICNDTYKFAANPYSICRNLQLIIRQSLRVTQEVAHLV